MRFKMGFDIDLYARIPGDLLPEKSLNIGYHDLEMYPDIILDENVKSKPAAKSTHRIYSRHMGKEKFYVDQPKNSESHIADQSAISGDCIQSVMVETDTQSSESNSGTPSTRRSSSSDESGGSGDDESEPPAPPRRNAEGGKSNNSRTSSIFPIVLVTIL